MGLLQRQREYTSAAIERGALADQPTGFNRQLREVERVLEAYQRRFDRGFRPGPDALALKEAFDACGVALAGLRALRWAAASPAARALLDAIAAEGSKR